ncbi:cobalt-precorrin-5B (C(1))-methyltransferase CbiD [Fusobacterium sp. MFO224]|uniref:cobalt-precorrin-5B (C(1))-methyltransferase CbiD n=1 Tax=Fusobacterium sp. MFO224 TaxID=3378070 RepID=UPI0038521976
MGNKLKSGYTTGSCCTAAIVAGLNYLFYNRKLENIKLNTLNDKKITIPIIKLRKRNKFVTAGVKKYSGDDPDVTNGIEIYAKIKIVEKLKKDEAGYLIGNSLITCGKGIGRVTKKGLRCEVGKYAINPGPLEMIEIALNTFLDNRKDIYLEIMLYIPKGREISKKTFNPKLGIVDGISILGSTGILNPMSEEALKDSLYVEMKVLKENSEKDYIVFVFGNYGKKYCKEIGLDTSNLIVISNYVGYMLEIAKELQYKKIIVVGHIGKAIKIAGGIFNTHSKIADARMEIMGANAFINGESNENVMRVLKSNTVEEACGYIENNKFFFKIANKVSEKIKNYLKTDEVECEVLLFSFKENILGYSDKFYKLIEEVKK